jgi:hypothetical protein
MGRASALVLLCMLALGAGVAGQAPGEESPRASGTWVDDFDFASANAVLAGLTAGIVSRLRGGSFGSAFAGGALGGGVAYLGKRVSAARFDGAGALGRQVGSLGASITRNAALQVGLLDTLLVTLGPVRLSVGRSTPRGTALHLDLHETYWLAYALAEEDLRMDWTRSVSAGAPVFTTDAALRGGRDDGFVNGMVTGGVIVLTHRARADLDDVFAHERVHIVQREFMKRTIGDPLERWARRATGLDGLGIADHLLTGLGYLPTHYVLSGAWEPRRSLFEVEAEFLEGR